MIKYIVTVKEDDTLELFTFPEAIHHDCFYEVVQYIKNHSGRGWQREHRRIVSAGFVTSQGVCFGESITLGVKSSPRDTELLRKQSGII